MIPCKECLILPICKNKPGPVKCQLLYDWYWDIPSLFTRYTKKIRIIEKYLGVKTLISMLPTPETNK